LGVKVIFNPETLNKNKYLDTPLNVNIQEPYLKKPPYLVILRAMRLSRDGYYNS
jgi:hypothetical protein